MLKRSDKHFKYDCIEDKHIFVTESVLSYNQRCICGKTEFGSVILDLLSRGNQNKYGYHTQFDFDKRVL